MKKYIFILFAACLFASCNDGLLFDDYLNELGYEFEETNLSALAVLTSGDYWEDNYLENVSTWLLALQDHERKMPSTPTYLSFISMKTLVI